MKLRRHPDLVLSWTADGLRLCNVATGDEVPGSGLAEILELFDEPLAPDEAVRRLRHRNPVLVRARVDALHELGFLVTERAHARVSSRLTAWAGKAASAQYHAACRDLPYASDPDEIASYARKTILKNPKPPLFKRYASGRRIRLTAAAAEVPADTNGFTGVLKKRRTIRKFQRVPVPFERFAHLFRDTFGITGLMMSDVFGPLVNRTSPSGGALHPIEAYPVVWNVEGVAPGVYHYDMAGNDLRMLRRGDFREAAVAAASDQKWVARAGFLCVLTAVFPRVLWKYPTEDSYRTLFLDAGHLAQTFCLVATSLGLGPFTTAAIQDSKIEKLLKIDGIEEFPVYLCGAGVPAKPSARGKRHAISRF